MFIFIGPSCSYVCPCGGRRRRHRCATRLSFAQARAAVDALARYFDQPDAFGDRRKVIDDGLVEGLDTFVSTMCFEALTNTNAAKRRLALESTTTLLNGCDLKHNLLKEKVKNAMKI